MAKIPPTLRYDILNEDGIVRDNTTGNLYHAIAKKINPSTRSRLAEISLKLATLCNTFAIMSKIAMASG